LDLAREPADGDLVQRHIDAADKNVARQRHIDAVDKNVACQLFHFVYCFYLLEINLYASFMYYESQESSSTMNPKNRPADTSNAHFRLFPATERIRM
jgi:hypothetical protein